MKNIDIEKLKDLPKKTSMRERGDRGWDYWGKNGDPLYQKIDGKFPWTHVERTLKKYKGKNVDKAFSAYCKIVNKDQQHLFWEELESHLPHRRRRWRYPYAYWYVDKNKNIQRYVPKKAKSKHVIYSHDIKWGYVHKVSGEVREQEGRWWVGFKEDMYDYVPIQGEVFEFDRKNDAYHKCYAEQLDKKRKVIRKLDKEKKNKQYSFLTRESNKHFIFS